MRKIFVILLLLAVLSVVGLMFGSATAGSGCAPGSVGDTIISNSPAGDPTGQLAGALAAVQSNVPPGVLPVALC